MLKRSFWYGFFHFFFNFLFAQEVFCTSFSSSSSFYIYFLNFFILSCHWYLNFGMPIWHLHHFTTRSSVKGPFLAFPSLTFLQIRNKKSSYHFHANSGDKSSFWTKEIKRFYTVDRCHIRIPNNSFLCQWGIEKANDIFKQNPWQIVWGNSRCYYWIGLYRSGKELS